MQEPVAYKGKEPYIFISYPHKIKDIVFPIISRLQSDSFRVWYDEGIDPGTEWNENIAQRINNCAYFIAFINSDFLSSHNCRNELGWAASRDKERLLIFLENVQLPDGIAIQHNQIQHIHWYTYQQNVEAAFSRLYEAKGISACRAAPPPQDDAPNINQNFNPTTNPQNTYTQYANPQAQRNPGGQIPPRQGGGVSYTGTGRLRTDRSLVLYIVLSLLTCGIYGLYFLYQLIKDVNTVCEGDGRHTSGLLVFFILTILTCGIYAYYWDYALGNRLADNAPRYGLSFQENGTTVLLWDLLGSLLCGIGPFVALYIIIKNTNVLCLAYNQYNHL